MLLAGIPPADCWNVWWCTAEGFVLGCGKTEGFELEGTAGGGTANPGLEATGTAGCGIGTMGTCAAGCI